MTVYNTNSLQVYIEGLVHWQHFSIKLWEISPQGLYRFSTAHWGEYWIFFFSCKDKLCMKATLNITRRECVSVRDEHLTVTHTHTRSQMKALKLAHWEVTVCIVGQNRPLHSDHTFAGYLSEAIHSISVSHPWKRLQTSDSNNSNTFDAVVSGENC